MSLIPTYLERERLPAKSHGLFLVDASWSVDSRWFSSIAHVMKTNQRLMSRFTRRLVNTLRPKVAIPQHQESARENPDAVFIWIPKSAGTSLWHAITGGTRNELLTPEQVKEEFSQRGIATFGHQSYTELLDEGYVSQEYDKRAFKFCFVRNPFDRAVSLYEYLKKMSRLHHNTSFRTFCHLVRDRDFDSIGLFNSRGISQCNQQVDWIRDRKGNQFVDFVGRFENLQADFESICLTLGLSTQVGHLNKSERSQCADYYDEETTTIIGKHTPTIFIHLGIPRVH